MKIVKPVYKGHSREPENTVKPVYKAHSREPENTVKPVYKGHSREPENVPFMSSSPLYIQVINICTIH